MIVSINPYSYFALGTFLLLGSSSQFVLAEHLPADGEGEDILGSFPFVSARIFLVISMLASCSFLLTASHLSQHTF